MTKIAFRVLNEVWKDLSGKDCFLLTCDQKGEWTCVNVHNEIIFESKKRDYVLYWIASVESVRAVSLTFNSRSIAFRHLKVMSGLLSCNIVHHYHGINQKEYDFSWSNGWRVKRNKGKYIKVLNLLSSIRRSIHEYFLLIGLNKKKIVRYFFSGKTRCSYVVEPNGEFVRYFEGVKKTDTIFFLPLFEDLDYSLNNRRPHIRSIGKLIFVTSGAFYKPNVYPDAAEEQLRVIKRIQLLSDRLGADLSIVVKESESGYAAKLKAIGSIREFSIGVNFNHNDALFIVPRDSTVNFECIISCTPCVSYNIFQSQAIIGRCSSIFGILDVSEIETMSLKNISVYCNDMIGMMRALGDDLSATAQSAASSLAKTCVNNSKVVQF